jgi:hypothetical protein
LTSAFRTHEQQQALYEKARQGLSRYPVARPGNSAHEYGYAIDLVFGNADARDVVRNIWVSYGGNLGNEDEVHFEFPNWRSLAAAAAPAPQEAPDTRGRRWDQLANVLLSFVPSLGYIMSIASIASGLAEAFGYDQSAALYYLSNPNALFRDAADLLESWGVPRVAVEGLAGTD